MKLEKRTYQGATTLTKPQFEIAENVGTGYMLGYIPHILTILPPLCDLRGNIRRYYR